MPADDTPMPEKRPISPALLGQPLDLPKLEPLEWTPARLTILDDDDVLIQGIEQTEDAPAVLDGQEYLSPQDVGKMVDLHPRVIQRAVNEGEIAAFKLRGKIRIRHADLDAWIEANRVEPYSVPDLDGD